MNREILEEGFMCILYLVEVDACLGIIYGIAVGSVEAYKDIEWRMR